MKRVEIFRRLTNRLQTDRGPRAVLTEPEQFRSGRGG
jgi:hypothetical protein